MKTNLLIALLFLSLAPLSFSQSQGRGSSGGGGAIAATEQTVGDANVTSWTAGTVRRTVAMSAGRTVALPLAASLAAGSRVMYIDKATTAASAFVCTILASGSDTVAGDISYAPFPGPGTMEFETDGVSVWTPVSDTATSSSQRDTGDPSKQGSYALGGNTTGTNRVMTWRDYNFTPVAFEGANAFTSTGTLDCTLLSPTAGFTLPIAGGAAPVTAGVISFDSVTDTIRYGNGSTTSFVASRQGSETIKNKTFDNTNVLSGYIAATEIAAPSSASANSVRYFADSTDHRFHDKNNAGTVGTTVVADTGAANNFVTAISAAGVISKAQPAVTDISGFGTGVATALAVNVGSAGAAVTFNGAGGTPSSLTGTNITGTANGLVAGDVTRNHAVYASGSPPTVDVGEFTVATTGVNLKAAATTAGFVVPASRAFMCTGSYALVTSVTTGGAGTETWTIKESGASASMAGGTASGSGTPVAGTYYWESTKEAGGPWTQCAAGNTVNIVVATSQAGSTAVTGTVYIKGFYTQ